MSKKSKLKHLKGWDLAFYICNGIFMVVFVIITLYPVVNTIAVSFNDGIDAVKGGIHIWPRVFTTKNYATVLGKQNIKTADLFLFSYFTSHYTLQIHSGYM